MSEAERAVLAQAEAGHDCGGDGCAWCTVAATVAEVLALCTILARLKPSGAEGFSHDGMPALEGKIKDGRYRSPDSDASHFDNVKLQGVTEGHKDGNRAEYLIRKIAKDHPDILVRMKDGEFRSVRARERGH